MRATGGHQAPLLALMLLTGVRLHLYPPTWATSPEGTLTTTKAEPPRFGACNRRAIAPARPRHRLCQRALRGSSSRRVSCEHSFLLLPKLLYLFVGTSSPLNSDAPQPFQGATRADSPFPFARATQVARRRPRQPSLRYIAGTSRCQRGVALRSGSSTPPTTNPFLVF